jgi:PAS domain S-box-containing protein
MTAVNLPVEVRYDAALTGLSLLFAIAACAVVFRLVGRGLRSPKGLAVSAVLLGSGIGAMHYTGMAAMHMDAAVRYDPAIFGLSIAVAVILSALALASFCYTSTSLEGYALLVHLAKAGAATVMGLSIAAVHYTAMAATYFVPGVADPMPGAALVNVTGIVAFATAGIIGSTLVAALVDARMEMKNRKIEESEGFLAAVVDSIADGVLAADEDGTIIMCNPAVEQMFGYGSGELMGKSVSLLMAPDKRATHEQYVRDAHLHHDRILGMRRALSVQRKNGDPFLVEIALSCMTRERGDIFIAVCHDVTERQLAEERLRESEKLNALGQLAGGVAHDFNNILMVIDGYTKRSLAMPGLPGNIAASLGEVEAAADKAKGLTRQLLAFGRRQVQEKTVIEAGPVIDEIDSLLRPLLGETVKLQVSQPLEDVRIEVDPALLSQALINLAINARDAMPHGGNLEIAMDVAEAGTAFLNRHPECRSGRYVAYSVRDEGEGMDEDTLARVFEPFFTTKAPGKGTGLGLAMVHGFVHQSEGALEVESEPGEGTTFTIYLPVAEKQATAAAREETRDLAARGETILLAEDDQAVRHLAETMLSDLGYTVLSAPDGFDALEIEAEHDGSIDLLLTDVVMPLLGGIELATAFRETRPGGKVLLMSGYPAHGEFKRIDKPDNVTLLQKPLEPNVLARAIRDTLDETAQAAA